MRRVCLLLLFLLRAVHAQTFAVVSIHPQDPAHPVFRVKPPGNGRFTAQGAALKFILMLAYDVADSQIEGGPAWIATDKWDVEAISDDGARHSEEETRLMLQHLLADRFSLKAHVETAPRPAYVLSVAKGGPKVHASSVRDGFMQLQISSNAVNMSHGPMARLTQVLATALNRPVVDRTGLSGEFDVSLEWDDAPNPNGGVPGLDTPAASGMDHGSIFTAIQEQLGLRLDPQRVPVKIVAIDHIERPSAN